MLKMTTLFLLLAVLLFSVITVRSEVPECSADQTTPIFLPDETDVTKFYECLNGNLYLFACPAGLNFNPTLSACDFPAQAELPECAADQTTPIFFPDDTDVTKFYECLNGNVYLLSCPSGLNFNPTLSVCDFPAQAELPECSADQTTPIYFPDETDVTKFYECLNGDLYLISCPSGLNFNPTLSVCDFPAQAELPECSADQTTPIFFPDETDVTKFYECLNGNLYSLSCASGLNFNPTLSVCDFPAQAELPECSADQTTPIYFPDETDVTRYYECLNGDLYLLSCASGLNFNPTLSVCDFPAQAELPECPADQTTPIFFPDVTDVTKFYECLNGDLRLLSCASGLNFNPTLEVCDFPA